MGATDENGAKRLYSVFRGFVDYTGLAIGGTGCGGFRFAGRGLSPGTASGDGGTIQYWMMKTRTFISIVSAFFLGCSDRPVANTHIVVEKANLTISTLDKIRVETEAGIYTGTWMRLGRFSGSLDDAVESNQIPLLEYSPIVLSLEADSDPKLSINQRSVNGTSMDRVTFYSDVSTANGDKELERRTIYLFDRNKGKLIPIGAFAPTDERGAIEAKTREAIKNSKGINTPPP